MALIVKGEGALTRLEAGAAGHGNTGFPFSTTTTLAFPEANRHDLSATRSGALMARA